MTFACLGTGVGSRRHVAIGPAWLLPGGEIVITPRWVTASETDSELERFRAAMRDARGELRAIREQIPEDTPSDIVAFIDTHLLILQDDALSNVVESLIREEGCAAEWALQLRREALLKVFDAVEDPYLRTRRDDINHLVNQVLKLLTGQRRDLDDNDALDGGIVVAHDISPADIFVLKRHRIAGLVTELGGPMSHTAILANSLGIPAVVGARHVASLLRDRELLIVDADNGTVLAEADPGILAWYHRRLREERGEDAALHALLTLPAITRDGVEIELMANIELPEDVELVHRSGADGIGLYRTEWLYMNRDTPPDEEEHFAVYQRVLEQLDGKPVVFRTLDLGADKWCENLPSQGCRNPALGLRAIRLCLTEPELFLPQLRALLRASALGPLRIMLPMLSSVDEVRQVRALIASTQRQLRRDGLAFDPEVPLGGMIEVPAAALICEPLARELDFLSIGTNDLIQYTLAIDRMDEEVTYLYDPTHPALLQLIRNILRAGAETGTPVSMCGEMAGETQYTRLLLGLGLTRFSMQPSALLPVKQRVLDADTEQLDRALRVACASNDADIIRGVLDDLDGSCG